MEFWKENFRILNRNYRGKLNQHNTKAEIKKRFSGIDNMRKEMDTLVKKC